MGVASAFELVGRDVEMQRLDGFIASLGTGAGAVVMSGGAGVGKTVLWREAAERAAARGMRVLAARCAEAEMPIAFGALADLIEEASGELADELPGQQRDALAAAFGRGEAEHASPDWLALAKAVLVTLRTLAQRGPVLVAVDDVRWLDPGSRRVLSYALRRTADEPVGLIVTVRDSQPAGDTLGLADSVSPDRVIWLMVGPLSLGAIQHLVSSRLGVHLARPTAARVHRASGGNPMFALEFARAVVAEHQGGQVAPLVVPSSLEQLVQARIGRFQGRVVRLLEIAAVLERPTLPVLARALGGGVPAGELLDEAVRADALVVDEDGLIRFTHPLLASAVYFGIGPGRRRALHRLLREAVEGAEVRGRHAALAAAGPDAATAELVEQAASAAASRSALDSAAGLIGEAVELTPVGDVESRWRRLLTCAGWLVETAEFSAARTRLEPLLAAGVRAEVRGEALVLRAECEIADRRLLVELLREALAVADQPRPRWQALIRLAHHAGWVSGDAHSASQTAREALEVALALDEGLSVEASLAALAFYETARGRFDAVPKEVSAKRRGRPPRMQWWQISPAISLGCRLLWAGELERARRILGEEHESLSSAGRDARAGFVLCWLSELEWRAGDWVRASTLAREATETLGDLNPTAFPRALLAASTGRTEEAYAIADGVLAWSETFDERVAPPRFRWLLGLLEISRNEPERARRSLAQALDQLDAAGIREPGYLPVIPDLIESLVASGRLEEAEPLMARLEADSAKSGHRWATLASRRSRALISLGRGDAHAAAALGDEAAGGFEAIGMPFERGRALLLAGEARRRAGERREAARRISDAAQIFAQLGAPLWLQRAEREMRRANPRPGRGHDQLTAAEARVAALVADGRTNKEAAASLYTSVATVEAHLTRIYRKLGLRSRSELARHMAQGSAGAEP